MMMIRLLLLFFLALLQLNLFAQLSVIREVPFTNDDAHAVLFYGDTVIVGGKFGQMSPPAMNGLLLNASDGSGKYGHDLSDMSTRCVISDGINGFFVGGSFNYFGGQSVGGIVHLDDQGKVKSGSSLGTSVPTVQHLARSDNWILYSSNNATEVSGVDTATGMNIGWNHSVTGIIRDLAVYNGILYVAGSFSAIDGMSRVNLAAIDIATGNILNWQVSVND